MKLKNAVAGVTALALCASVASAQIPVINEIYASHDGVDDQEYVEIYGPAGFDLVNCLILVVEGDGVAQGTLDRAWDLTGFVIPDDGGGFGFIVVGGSAVANLDLDVGATNVIENGTETFYLVVTPDPAAIVALVGTDVDADDDCEIELPAGTGIRDVVAMVDTGYPETDAVYDLAQPLGPDGSFFPAGVFRPTDGGPWCHDTWLDFFDGTNLDQPRTPGASNVGVCDAVEPGTALCFGTSCPCANDDPTAGCANSTGVGALLGGSGSTSVATDDLVLTASQLPPNNQGLFYMGNKAVKNPFFDGFQCALGTTLRFLNDIQNSGPGGTMTLGTGIVLKSGGLIQPGTTWYFHAWHRDTAGPCGTGANLTHIYGVTFTP